MSSWLQQLDASESPSQVVAITRDYLATWSPDEIAQLPMRCRPGRVKDEHDIAQLHVCLVEEYGRDRLAGDALSALQRITSFIVRASVRIAQIRTGEKKAPGEDEDRAPPPAPRSKEASDR
ncbi:MAG: hypothetical protein ABIR98_11245 [Usitatibacter sp.]